MVRTGGKGRDGADHAVRPCRHHLSMRLLPLSRPGTGHRSRARRDDDASTTLATGSVAPPQSSAVAASQCGMDDCLEFALAEFGVVKVQRFDLATYTWIDPAPVTVSSVADDHASMEVPTIASNGTTTFVCWEDLLDLSPQSLKCVTLDASLAPWGNRGVEHDGRRRRGRRGGRRKCGRGWPWRQRKCRLRCQREPRWWCRGARGERHERRRSWYGRRGELRLGRNRRGPGQRRLRRFVERMRLCDPGRCARVRPCPMARSARCAGARGSPPAAQLAAQGSHWEGRARGMS